MRYKPGENSVKEAVTRLLEKAYIYNLSEPTPKMGLPPLQIPATAPKQKNPNRDFFVLEPSLRFEPNFLVLFLLFDVFTNLTFFHFHLSGKVEPKQRATKILVWL